MKPQLIKETAVSDLELHYCTVVINLKSKGSTTFISSKEHQINPQW